MAEPPLTPSQYFRTYRLALGFSSQGTTKDFLAAKDISPAIDMEYARLLRDRIKEMVRRVNGVIFTGVRIADIDQFCREEIDASFQTVVENGLIDRLTNQGRRREEVLFSWLRGRASQRSFAKSIALAVGAAPESVRDIGDDDITNPAIFRRTPAADLELDIAGTTVRVEVQSGFQGINDIKQHKVLEARRRQADSGLKTICVHFDLFNGQAAFVRLDTIEDTDVNWVTRQQMEGQTVLSIDQNYFVWRLLDALPDRETLDLGLEAQ